MSVTSHTMAEGSCLVEARGMEKLDDVVLVVVVCEEATGAVEAVVCGKDNTEDSVDVDTMTSAVSAATSVSGSFTTGAVAASAKAD